ncbi:hypothetical protein ACQJBY_042921 [Aegilops geniculata]
MGSLPSPALPSHGQRGELAVSCSKHTANTPSQLHAARPDAVRCKSGRALVRDSTDGEVGPRAAMRQMSVHSAGPGGRSGAATGADGAPSMLQASNTAARRFFPTAPLLRGSSRCDTPGCVVLQRSIARDPSVLQRNIAGDRRAGLELRRADTESPRVPLLGATTDGSPSLQSPVPQDEIPDPTADMQ